MKNKSFKVRTCQHQEISAFGEIYHLIKTDKGDILIYKIIHFDPHLAPPETPQEIYKRMERESKK